MAWVKRVKTAKRAPPPRAPAQRKAEAAEPPAEPQIAEGAFTIALAGGVSEAAQERAKRLEKAMSDAILQAHDEGIRDPNEIRARILAARDQFLKDEASHG